MVNLPSDLILLSRDLNCNINMSSTRSHKGTAGASPMIRNSKIGVYRKAKLGDLYDAANLVDRLKNVQFFSRSTVANNMKKLSIQM